MNVLMISPGFPKEMQYFTRGLATVGARPISTWNPSRTKGLSWSG